MADETGNNTNEFLGAIVENLRNSGCTDSRGKPISDFLPSEFSALMNFLLKVVELRGATLRHALELPPDARKYVLIYAGVFSIIEADARRSGRNILFLSADSNSDARAQLEYRAMRQFTMSTRIEFLTWDDIQPKPENGFKPANLNQFWIIGDTDWSDQPQSGSTSDLKKTAIERVLAGSTCPVLLLHQQGKVPVIPFPPVFGRTTSGKGGCFIATVACDSPNAPEVIVLQEFRDRVLVKNITGRFMIRVYNRFSPLVAEWIKYHPVIRKIVRNLLIRPIAQLLARCKSFI